MLARGLVTQQSYNISLVFSRQFGNLAAPFLRKTVSAVYDIAARNDYDVLMTMVGEQETSPMQRLLVNRKIDGVILARTLERDPLIPMLKKAASPLLPLAARLTRMSSRWTMIRWAAAASWSACC